MSGYQKVQQQSQQNKLHKAQEKPDKQARQKAAPERLMQDSSGLSSEDVLSAQQQVGNQVVQRALDHSLAREANTDEQGNLHPHISNEIQQLRGSGNTLPKEIQSEVSGSFGKDFSRVRIHTDDKADRLSRTINARAFTIGSDIFFKNGVYAPSSPKGRDTLLHELTHVVQQSGGKSSGGQLKLGAVGSSHEKEAENTAKRLANRGQNISAAGAGAAVQKQEDEDVQMLEDEDVQMQEDEDVQMQEDEDVQMQEDEDVQMQPEGGVIQRVNWKVSEDLQDRVKKFEGVMGGNRTTPSLKRTSHMPPTKALPPTPTTPSLKRTGHMPPTKALPPIPTKPAPVKHTPPTKAPPPIPAPALPEKSVGKFSVKQAKGKTFEDIKGGLAQKAEGHGRVSEGVSNLEKKNSTRAQEMYTGEKSNTKENLMNIIQNPLSKPEDIKMAEEKLNTLHKRGKMDTLKSMFKRRSLSGSYASEAQDNRKKGLEDAARGGDEEAYKTLKAEKKPGMFSKLKGMATEYGPKALGMLKGLGGGGGGGSKGGGIGDTIKTLFLGPDVKKKEGGEKEEAKGGGGGDGGGGGGVMGAIVHLTEEIATLKQQIAGLKGAKPEETAK